MLTKPHEALAARACQFWGSGDGYRETLKRPQPAQDAA